MSMIKPRTLSGFMELLPAKQAKLEKMMQVLRTTYASFGFAALDLAAGLLGGLAALAADR